MKTRWLGWFAVCAVCLTLAAISGCGGGNSGGDDDDEQPNPSASSGFGSIIGTIGMSNVGKAMVMGGGLGKDAAIDLTALTVKLDGRDSDFETHPDASGKFTFSDIPVGEYTLNIIPYDLFPLQAYYPSAVLDVESDTTLNLSIPVVRGIPVGVSDFDPETLVIDSTNGAILAYSNEADTLVRIVDNGDEAEAEIGTFTGVEGTYVGKDDTAGLFYTQVTTSSLVMYDYSWGPTQIGTKNTCNIFLYDNSFNEVYRLVLGEKDAKITETRVGPETYYNYNDDPDGNCPISYTIDDVNHTAYFLAELTEDDKRDLGVGSGRKVVALDPISRSFRNYAVSADAAYVIADRKGSVYVVNNANAKVEVYSGAISDLRKLNEVPFYKNGIQPDMDISVNPQSGDLYVIYLVNKVGTTESEPWLLVVNSSGNMLLDASLFDALGGDADWEPNYYGGYGAMLLSKVMKDGGGGGDGDSGTMSDDGTCSAEEANEFVSKISEDIRQGLIRMVSESRGYWEDGVGAVVFRSDSAKALIGWLPVNIPVSVAETEFEVIVPEKLLPKAEKVICYHRDDGEVDYAYSCDRGDPSSVCESSYYYDERSYPSWLNGGGFALSSEGLDWSHEFIYALKSYDSLSVKRYSMDLKDIDVDVGLLFMDQKELKTLVVNQTSVRVYTFDPNSGELLVLE